MRHMENHTQATLAELAGISLEHLNKLERGVAAPSFKVMEALSVALGVPAVSFFLHQAGQCATPQSPSAVGSAGRLLIGLWREDGSAETLLWCDGLHGILGYAPDEITPSRALFLDHVVPEYRAQMLDALEEACVRKAQASPMRFEFTCKHGLRRQAIALWQADPLVGDGDCCLGVILDVTHEFEILHALGHVRVELEQNIQIKSAAWKKAKNTLAIETKLRKNVQSVAGDMEAVQALLLTNSADAICIKDSNNRWLKANRAMCSLFEMDEADCLGKTCAELAALLPKHQEHLLRHAEDDEKVWLSMQAHASEDIIILSDGSQRVYHFLKTPHFGADGNRLALVTVGRDITPLKLGKQQASASAAEGFRA